MPAVLLDANAYRKMGRVQFDALVELERQRQVTRYAEPFALQELLAHLLDDPASKVFRSCRASVDRVYRRCAGDGPCGIIRDSESRIAEAVTGKGLAKNDEHTEQLRLLLMHVGQGHPLALIEPQLRSIADHIAAEEARWADTMRRLQKNADAPQTQKDDPMRMRIMESSRDGTARYFLRIAGQAPSGEAVARVRRGAAGFVEFGARIFDRVVFDRVNVDLSKIRNFLWDLRLAFNIGQTIGPRTLWVVTCDGAFAEAAAATGFGDRVYSVTAYEQWLSS